MSSRRRHTRSSRDPGAQRSSRLNELLREIIAEELRRIDDERLEWVSVTHVQTDRSLDQAIVLFTAALGELDDEAALVAVFEQHRPRLQRAINRQTNLRRTPPLVFQPDTHLRQASRIEELLAQERDRPGTATAEAARAPGDDGDDGAPGDDDAGGAEARDDGQTE